MLNGSVGFVINAAAGAAVAEDFEVIDGVGRETAKDGLLHSVRYVFVGGVVGYRRAINGGSDITKACCAHADKVAVGQRCAGGVGPVEGDGVGREVGGMVSGLGVEACTPNAFHKLGVVNKRIAVALVAGVNNIVARLFGSVHRVVLVPLKQGGKLAKVSVSC